MVLGDETGERLTDNQPDIERLSRWKIASRGGSHAADSRAWEPALLQNFHLLRLAGVGAHGAAGALQDHDVIGGLQSASHAKPNAPPFGIEADDLDLHHVAH